MSGISTPERDFLQNFLSVGSLLSRTRLEHQLTAALPLFAPAALAPGHTARPFEAQQRRSPGALLYARVKASLRRDGVDDSLELSDPLLFALARSVEERDSSLGRHCERLALMSAVMGLRMGLGAEDLRTLQRGGYVHDIGKIALPDAVLLKSSPLDEHEWEIMKTHPARGEAICSRARSLQSVLPLIRHHHERWDGSGYPDGLKGEQIPLLARILQMADIYDALTAERSYKRAFSPEQALEIIREETRREWRDPTLLPVLEAVIPLFRSESFWDLAPLSLSALGTALYS